MTALLLTTAISESSPLIDASLLPGPMVAMADAALRALLVAGAVWGGLQVMAARNIVAQKTAWALVLAGAFLMPFLVPWAATMRSLPNAARLAVPLKSWMNKLAIDPAAISAQPQSATATATTPASAFPRVRSQSNPMAAGRFDRSTAPVASQADRFPSPVISKSSTSGVEPGYAGTAGRRLLAPSDMVWLLYGAVSLGLILRLLYGLVMACDVWRSAEPVRIEVPRLADGLRIRASRLVASPVTIGSAIVLPADYDEWDAEKLRIVLAHERSHIRQGDFYLQALAGLYAAIFWFSPLGWWLKRTLSDLGEAISDHAGLVEAASHASYAQVLLEFAALPRRMQGRTQIGVAMARTGRLTQRIERLLNESSFRQAFAGGRRRMMAVLFLVPVALFAAAALIRVEAAQTLQQPAAAQGPIVGQSRPEAAANPVPAPPSPVLAVQTQNPAPVPPSPDTGTTPATAPVAPVAPADVRTPQAPVIAIANSEDADDAEDADQVVTINSQCKSHSASSTVAHSASHGSSRHGYTYSSTSGGDSYALVTGSDRNNVQFSGDWMDGRRGDLEKARKMVHGDFLWFTRGGKSYVVEDPATLAQIQAMYKPMEDLGRQQEELGRQQEQLGRQQGELGEQQEQASIPTPDIAKEMADLNKAVSQLQAKKNGMITQDQIAELEGKLGDLQGKLGELQGEIGSKQGELGRRQGLLGEQQGKLGEQQGRLGAEQGRLATEVDRKVKSMIDQSLKDGKARPVQ